MIEFLTSRVADWAELMTSPKMGAIGAVLLVILAIDLHRRGWQLSWSRRAVMTVVATLSIFHFNILFLPLVWFSVDRLEGIYRLAGIPSVSPEFWAGVPLLLAVPIAILAHDFVDYWVHRLLHLRWFWPIHVIHHSDPEVNGLTAYRVHLLEVLMMWSGYLLLLTWLGLPGEAIKLGAVLRAVHNIYIHANFDIEHGWFRYLVASPRFHRWHHADVPRAYGKNLAGFFPLYDRMFGTYYVPGPCTVAVGAAGGPENDVARLLLWPFLEWPRMIAKRLARLARGSRVPATTSAAATSASSGPAS